MKTQMNAKLIISLIFAGLAVLFIVQNYESVDFKFMIWTWSMSRALLMFFMLAIGILMGWILHSYALHRRKKG